MATPGIEARKQLREAVRKFWDSDTGFAMQEALRETALKTIEEGYEACIREGTKPIKECYREVAKKVNLSEEYRKVWGSP